jgi:hypothetical protein
MIDDAAKNSAVILSEAKDPLSRLPSPEPYSPDNRAIASPKQTAELPLIKQLGPIHALALKHD